MHSMALSEQIAPQFLQTITLVTNLADSNPLAHNKTQNIKSNHAALAFMKLKFCISRYRREITREYTIVSGLDPYFKDGKSKLKLRRAK